MKQLKTSDKDNLVHLSHCFQGENEGSCKYGTLNCPAEPETTMEIRQGDVVSKDGKNYLVVQSFGSFATVTDFPGLSINRFNWSLKNVSIQSCSTLETREQAKTILSRSRFK